MIHFNAPRKLWEIQYNLSYGSEINIEPKSCLKDDTPLILNEIDNLDLDIKRTELKDLHESSILNSGVRDKIMADVLNRTKFYYAKSDIKFPSVALLPHSYIFRFALCAQLLILNTKNMRIKREQNK